MLVGTTMANLGLERALERSGLKLTRTDVGDRYVLEEMLRSGANLGGEQSGHILFLDDATTGDGMLTAVKIASIVSIAGSLDSLVADLKIFPQKIVNVRVRSKPPLESIPEVARTLKEAESALGNSGRVVLRYSGTEPLARVMVEAEREEDVRRWTESLAAALRSAIGSEGPRARSARSRSALPLHGLPALCISVRHHELAVQTSRPCEIFGRSIMLSAIFLAATNTFAQEPEVSKTSPGLGATAPATATPAAGIPSYPNSTKGLENLVKEMLKPCGDRGQLAKRCSDTTERETDGCRGGTI